MRGRYLIPAWVIATSAGVLISEPLGRELFPRLLRLGAEHGIHYDYASIWNSVAFFTVIAIPVAALQGLVIGIRMDLVRGLAWVAATVAGALVTVVLTRFVIGPHVVSSAGPPNQFIPAILFPALGGFLLGLIQWLAVLWKRCDPLGVWPVASAAIAVLSSLIGFAAVPLLQSGRPPAPGLMGGLFAANVVGSALAEAIALAYLVRVEDRAPVPALRRPRQG